MSEWIAVSERKPPEDIPVLAWGKEYGIMAVTYNYYPAWEPFDEALYATALPAVRDSMRRLNELRRGEPAKESWACLCEDSYWKIEEFTHWRELPAPPIQQ